jgi:hypothetical protein
MSGLLFRYRYHLCVLHKYGEIGNLKCHSETIKYSKYYWADFDQLVNKSLDQLKTTDKAYS